MKKLDKNLLSKNIERIALYDIEENNIFGSAYAVYQDGEELYRGYFGTKAPEKCSAVCGDTVFRLASMTKPITAVAALILAERGLISLDDPIVKYVPEFEGVHIKNADGNGKLTDMGCAEKSICVYHLLSHTSGIGCGGAVQEAMPEEGKLSVKNMVEYFAKAGIDFEPGTRQGYSAVAAFDVMVAIIERVTGEDYQEFLKRELFEPLKMCDTTFEPAADAWERMMTMHNRENGKSIVGKTYDGCVFDDFPTAHRLGGAGLVSTLDDYTKFANMLLNGGKTEAARILEEKTVALMHIPYADKSIMPGDEIWGLGVRIIAKDSYPSLPVGAFGWSGAYGTHFWIDPENKITAVFMKNSRFDGGAGNKSACRFEEAVYNSFQD